MSEHHLIDDVDEPEITAEYVRRRVEDWLLRLDNLFNEIKSWAAKNGWTAVNGAPIPMLEDLMRRLGVSQREQPSLFVRNSDGAEVWIKPKGLWVIGANGRVDLYSRKGVFALVDVADKFDVPQWILHRVGKGEGQPFDPSQIADMI